MQQNAPVVDAATTEDAVVQLVMAIGRRFRSRIEGDVVEPSQAALLYTLKCQGAMRLGDIAEAMKLDASTVSRHVHQLGERGFLDREPDPDDGRARIIAISDSGRASLRHTFDQRRAIITAALTDWDDADRDRLRHDLARLTATLGDLA
ncbi:MarR family winged helix-turn-helix transcriptional regulator [Aeromicrobium stalagmiti]|uniref:MarR family winged helix-turn-helix transcriptional regulator n=1 Tax=Aeromicrobium stalagmiti TaxID=2738988 RepID=UPI0015692FD3|nr:MarR family transcriptional regulator [Aeromicrobium stalagmiti]NRQ51692.1 MarR family transcriptional regulator [Aeromicrobium stalagmiti]